MSNNGNSGSGITFCTVLGIVFIILKLCGVIGWSWWWVLAPIWIPIAISLLFILVFTIFTRK